MTRACLGNMTTFRKVIYTLLLTHSTYEYCSDTFYSLHFQHKSLKHLKRSRSRVYLAGVLKVQKKQFKKLERKPELQKELLKVTGPLFLPKFVLQKYNVVYLIQISMFLLSCFLLGRNQKKKVKTKIRKIFCSKNIIYCSNILPVLPKCA